jgi:hypothetical protein
MPMQAKSQPQSSTSSACRSAHAPSAFISTRREDGAEIVNGVADRVRAEMFRQYRSAGSAETIRYRLKS